MNQHLHKLLTILDQAKSDGGDGWVLSAKYLYSIPYHVRQLAQVKGCIEGRGVTSQREYRILPYGQEALDDHNAGKTTKSKRDHAAPRTPIGLDLEVGSTSDEEINGEPVVEFPGMDSVIRKGPVPVVTPSINSTLEKNIAINFSLIPDVRVRACVQAIAILGENFQEVNDLVNALVKINARKARDHE